MGARACIIRLQADRGDGGDHAAALTAINRTLSQVSSSPRLNPLDYCYFALGVDAHWLPKTHPEHQLVHRYMHASHPEGGGQQWELYDVFTIQRKGERERYEPIAQRLGNRRLLWHGSGVGNFAGLLTQGLRIAPPEANVSGYAFGKGVYTADQFVKSIGYCHNDLPQHPHQRHTRHQQQQAKTLCLILAEVALGKSYEAVQAVYMEAPQTATNSTLGVGRRTPDPTQSLHTVEGVEVPCGAIVARDREQGAQPLQLEMNEYIVYDEAQVRMRYVVRVGPVRRGRTKEDEEREQREVQWADGQEDSTVAEESAEEDGVDGDGDGGEGGDSDAADDEAGNGVAGMQLSGDDDADEEEEEEFKEDEEEDEEEESAPTTGGRAPAKKSPAKAAASQNSISGGSGSQEY